MGITKKDKDNEEKDKEAIRKAISGEGINHNAVLDSPRRRSRGMNFPSAQPSMSGTIIAKFTLMNIYTESQYRHAATTDQPTDEEIDPLSQPIQVGATGLGCRMDWRGWFGA